MPDALVRVRRAARRGRRLRPSLALSSPGDEAEALLCRARSPLSRSPLSRALRYRESAYLGDCGLTKEEVQDIVNTLKPKWWGPSCESRARASKTRERGARAVAALPPERGAPLLFSPRAARADDLLQKNCCSFSREFALSLGVGDVPSWIDRLAKWGTALQGQKKGEVTKPSDQDLLFMEHVMASRVQSRFRTRKWQRIVKALKAGK